jgi:hypothetical protein
MNLPSIKTIEHACNRTDDTPRKAAMVIRRIMEGTLNPDEFRSVEKWIRQCYHMPRLNERKMCAINEVLRGHGIEAIQDRHGNYVAEYVRMAGGLSARGAITWKARGYRV